MAPHWLFAIASLLPALTSCGASPAETAAGRGRVLAAELGCASCHSINGGIAVGPTWKGLHGSQVTLTNGTTVTADDAYLAGRLANPGAVTVAGYPRGTMTAALQPHRAMLSKPENVEAIIAYIKSLK